MLLIYTLYKIYNHIQLLLQLILKYIPPAVQVINTVTYSRSIPTFGSSLKHLKLYFTSSVTHVEDTSDIPCLNTSATGDYVTGGMYIAMASWGILIWQVKPVIKSVM